MIVTYSEAGFDTLHTAFLQFLLPHTGTICRYCFWYGIMPRTRTGISAGTGSIIRKPKSIGNMKLFGIIERYKICIDAIRIFRSFTKPPLCSSRSPEPWMNSNLRYNNRADTALRSPDLRGSYAPARKGCAISDTSHSVLLLILVIFPVPSYWKIRTLRKPEIHRMQNRWWVSASNCLSNHKGIVDSDGDDIRRSAPDAQGNHPKLDPSTRCIWFHTPALLYEAGIFPLKILTPIGPDSDMQEGVPTAVPVFTTGCRVIL